MTTREYQAYVKERSPASPLGKNMVKAFVSGGVICIIGQLVMNLFAASGLDQESAGMATSVTMVFLGALLTGLGVYDGLAKFGGAGTLVPITGFANAIASPALEYKSEGFVAGMAAKMFIVAGPVIVFGVSASVLYGLLLVIFGAG